MTFPEWIKERRRILGLTQTQVSTQLGIHQAKVSSLETGKLRPDAELLKKITEVFGQFDSKSVPNNTISIDTGPKKAMSDKVKEALKAYREAKEESFYLELSKNTYITADRYQYVLRQNGKFSYYTDLKSLLKNMIASEMRQSAVSSVKEIISKLDEIYNNIVEKFDNYDPANIVSHVEIQTELDDEDETDEMTAT